MTHSYPSWLEISASALRHQVRLFQKLAPSAKLFPVVKGNAYGHGLREVMQVIGADKGIDAFAVASLDEALELSTLTKKPIIILSYWQRDTKKVAQAIVKDFVFTIYAADDARWLDAQAHTLNTKARIHIKVDVGTMRIGLRDDELSAIDPILKLPNLALDGILAHFADSESKDETFANEQRERFEKVISYFSDKGYGSVTKHIACSAAALRKQWYHCDGIRVGISLYGLWPSDDIKTLMDTQVTMKPVLSWKTRIIQIKALKRGETVGYDRTYRSPHDTRMAILPIGYWDGYDRSLSNRSYVLIGGSRCRVIGRVCMNITSVDLAVDVHAREGDEVILIGRQGTEKITADELAGIAGTINYETVTRINSSTPRFVVE